MQATFDDIKARVGDNVLGTIQKLLSLATSDNENESAEAMNKAMSLLARHQLSMDDITLLNEQEEAIDNEDIVSATRNTTRWRQKLIQAVAETHFCYLYQKPRTYNRDRKHRFVVTGRETNRRAAVMLFRALEASIELGALKARAEYKGWGDTKAYLLSYREGMTDAICKRLYNQQREVVRDLKATSTELVPVNPYVKAEKENLEFIQSGGTRLRTAYSAKRNSMGDASGYNRGRQDGESVHLQAHRAITA